MFCNKCGAEIDLNSNFCNKCGQSLENYPKKGKITFVRQGQYYGCLVPIKVFMDGQLVVTMNNGTEATIETTIGKHQINFNLWSGKGADEIEVTAEHPHIKVTYKVGMGAITAKPKIVKIENV